MMKWNTRYEEIIKYENVRKNIEEITPLIN